MGGVFVSPSESLLAITMPRLHSSFAVLFNLCIIAITLGTVVAHPLEKRQCQATLTTALTVAHRLQDHYFSEANGQYNGGSLWTDANAMEDLHNLMLATGTNDFADVADISRIGKASLDNSTSWQTILAGSNDDAGWIVLALWKMADYKAARGLDNSVFLNNAATIYSIIAGQWDDTCGGGVWWSTAHTYKNAITNELFLLLSASGYLRNNNPSYLANANRTWAWLKNSGMRNSGGLWNDGLDSSTCKNNGQTTWTYNQGVIASGLGALSVATGDKSLLDQAEITLDSTIGRLTLDGILRETCDSTASGGSVCNADQQIFKGIWTKHLQYYLDYANDPARTAKYSAFLGAQSTAVRNFATNASNDVGSVWFGPNLGGSVFSPKTSTSGLAAHVSAAKYGPC